MSQVQAPPLAGSGSSPAGSETVDLVGIFAILRRHRWLVVAVTIAGTLLFTLASLLIRPEYTAEAQLVVDPRPNDVLEELQAMLPGLEVRGSAIPTTMRLLQSPALHARVMEDLGLFHDPEFNPFARLPEGQAPRAPREGLARILGFVPEDWLVSLGLAEERRALREDEAARLAREIALARFRKGLEIIGDNSSVIVVAYTASDPEKAARIANRIVELFVDEQLKSKLLSTSRVSRWLEERLATLREEVQRAEAAVEKYRAEHNLVSAQREGPTLSDQELADLNKELILAKAELAEKRSKLALIRQLRAAGKGLDSVPEVAASPVMINLRQQETEVLRREAELSTLYGEKHPRMQQLRREKAELAQKIDAEVNRIVKTIENEARSVAARVAVLERQLAAAKTRTTANREVEVRLRELERQAETSRQLYENLLERYKELQRREKIVEPDVRIVAKATPPASPSSPGPRLFAAVGFGVSLLGGFFLALVRERFDRTFRTGREIEVQLELPVLARVPLLRLRRGQSPARYLLEKPLSLYAESVRGVYTGLRLGSADRPPRVVCVTSSLPEEGKTTLAVSLALFAARSGKRVLLVDLDLRHPSVHRELGWQARTGVVEYMLGETSLEEVVHHDAGSGVHFVPVKAQTSNPTDVLESAALDELFAFAREHFDLVVVDSAPVLAVTDGKLAALRADRTVFTVRWAHTEREAAEEAVRGLREVGIEPAGAVLTFVDLKKLARYGSGYGYGDSGRYYTKASKYYID